jgi:hypothetical protein
MFFSPAWFCTEPRSTVLHVLLFSKRSCHNVLCSAWITFCFAAAHHSKSEPPKHRIWYYPLVQIHALGEVWFVLYSNNSQSQKVKTCGRTIRFSAGLHCQAQKVRWTELIGGRVFSVSPWWVVGSSRQEYVPGTPLPSVGSLGRL